jgi:hypothetical protein
MSESLNITINDINIRTFNQYIDTIFRALDISIEDQKKLKKEILKFNNKDKNKIISNDNINIALGFLITADKNINDIKNDYIFFEDIQVEWEYMTQHLAKLQTFILLENIKTNKCSKFISSLNKVLTSKIDFINKILETNISTKNNEFNIVKKYLKYKNKYINLKKDI